MPGAVTEVTEIGTALGVLFPDLPSALAAMPAELHNVPDDAWEQLVDTYKSGEHAASFETAFANGAAFLAASDGLRGRRPQLVEWKGPHRPPGDDVIPADLRFDHVYLVSCKYLSKVLLNAGPARLFDRGLVGDERDNTSWFHTTAPTEFQAFYASAGVASGKLPLSAARDLTADEQHELREVLRERKLPEAMQAPWSELCDAVARASAERWCAALDSPRAQLRMLWRLLRISGSTYYVLGADHTEHLRLRVASNWDWMQQFELREMAIAARPAGQPEVAWSAAVRERDTGHMYDVVGHVEIRWSHGRFVGHPEAKVYLDTPHSLVPGYHELQ